jgi:hypothetical protein
MCVQGLPTEVNARYGEIFSSFAPNIYKHFISGHCININYCIYPAEKAEQSYQSIDG